jgi:hypothetical protein
MSTQKRIGIFFAACLVASGLAEFLEHPYIQGVPALVSTAHAVVGRPLTPVSVAGVARRTTRRCAVGVYNC